MKLRTGIILFIVFLLSIVAIFGGEVGTTYSLASDETYPLSRGQRNSSLFDNTRILDQNLTATPGAELVGQYEILAFIDSPTAPVASPYVILYAAIYNEDSIQIIYEGAEIRGTRYDEAFSCSSVPCILPIYESTLLSFGVYSQYGSVEEVQASIEIWEVDGGYAIEVSHLTEFLYYQDTCHQVWGGQAQPRPGWAAFPQTPFQLNTNKTLHYLVSQLVTNGIVDTQDCPGGGWEGVAPNACAIERAAVEMRNWQNQYDLMIWKSAAEVGIPPKLLKTLIELESQFWPSNQRLYLDEFGLGQINQLGIDVLFRKNPTIYQAVCRSVFSSCTSPYVSLAPSTQALLRGAFMEFLNAGCANCPYGLDLEKANQSIPWIAHLLVANCNQTKSILEAHQATVNYEDFWKLTMVSYHNGVDCLDFAVSEAAAVSRSLNWAGITPYLVCRNSNQYVARFWNSLVTFDNYRLMLGEMPESQEVAAINPTHTPEPTPTPILSTAEVIVHAFIDKNGNGLPEDQEWIDRVAIWLRLPDGTIIEEFTVDGLARFDMTGYSPGSAIQASVPGLYRIKWFELPVDGSVLILFRFEQPNLPQYLP